MIRTSLLEELFARAKVLKKFASIPIKDLQLTSAEQQELVKKGMSFTVNRMDEPHVHISDVKRASMMKEAVLKKRGGQ